MYATPTTVIPMNPVIINKNITMNLPKVACVITVYSSGRYFKRIDIQIISR
jgi:hypothetical protein